jgi:TatD DNase family protein
MIKYIDIHSHLSFADYKQDLLSVIEKMEKNDVATICVGSDYISSKESIEIAEKFKNIFSCIGLHPGEKKTETFDEKKYGELVKNSKVVAIGECGLDYFRLKDDIEVEIIRQKKEFIKQIEFAIKYKRPLMLHIRDSEKSPNAYSDAYEILKKYKGKVTGNMHFFAGSLDWAKKFIDLGFTLSFTGVITFPPKADQPRADAIEIIRNVPLDKIHAETDAPFVAPIPYRGKRNEPVYVIEVIKKIAEIRGENLEKVRIQLLENSKKTFGLKF